MQTAELKTFEKMTEGIVLFNEDGTFDYINETGGDLLWGHRDDDGLYKALAGIVSNLVGEAQHLSIMVALRNVSGDCEIKCSISRINGYILAVLGKRLDDKPRGFGVASPLGVIRDILYLMSSVYVGGRPIMAQDNYISEYYAAHRERSLCEVRQCYQ